MRPGMEDALLISKIAALPAGASTVVGTAVDLGVGAKGDFNAGEFLITIPALATGALGDDKTITYAVIESANSDLSSPTTKMTHVQTGAGGAGHAGTSFRWRPATDTKRYVGIKATGVSGVSAAASSATMAFRAIS